MGDTDLRLNADAVYALRKLWEEDMNRLREHMQELRRWCSHRREDGSYATLIWEDSVCQGCGAEIPQ